MATTSTKTIRVVVDPSGAVAGAAKANAALAQIGNTANGAGASLTTSFGNAGRAVGQLSSGLNAANNNAKGLGSLFGSLGASANAAAGQLTGLGGSLASIGFAGAALGATAVVGGLVALGAAAVDASAKFESYRASLTTVLGSTEKAGEAFNALVDFAAKTPFSLDQSVQGFIKLKALGLQPSERALLSYGNTASAMGRNLNDMVEAVADAATGEFERIKGFGVTAKTQGDQVAFTFAGVTTKVKKNKEEIQKYLMELGETKFAGAMARQMETTQGAISNFQDRVTQTLAAIGDGGLNKSVGKFINLLTDGLSAATPVLVSVGNVLSGLVSGFGSIVTGVGAAFGAINSATPTGITLMETLTFGLNGVGQAFQVIGTVVGAVFGAVGNIVKNTAILITEGFRSAIGFVGFSFDAGGRSWSNSIMGVLRAVKFVASQLPQFFAIAISDTMRMFRDLGNGIAAALKGNFSLANSLFSKKQFVTSSRALDRTISNAGDVYGDQKGADAAWKRMLGRTPRGKAGFPDFTDTNTNNNGAGKTDKDAENRQKRENEFWKTLEGELSTARLFGLEAQQRTKELELQKILGKEISATDKARVDGLVQSIANEKAITSLKQASFELENKNTLARARALGMSEDQAKIEDALDAQRLSAMNAGVDIANKDYQTWLAKYRTVLETNQALEKQAALIKGATDAAKGVSAAFASTFEVADIQAKKDTFLKAYQSGQFLDGAFKPISAAMAQSVIDGFDKGIKEAADKPFKVAIDFATDAMKDFGSTTERRGVAQKEYDERMKGLKEARDAGKLSAGEFRAGVAKAGDDLRQTFAKIGDDFSNKVRTVADILYRVGNAIGGKLGDLIGSISDVGDRVGAFSSTKGDIAGSITKAFGESKFVRGLGNAVGGAVASLEIGEQVGKLGKSLGLKGQSETGAKVGSTIGGLAFGPLGAIGGGVLGSLVGSLFGKSAPKSNAVITSAQGFTSTGSNKALTKAAGGAAESIQSGLADIAKQLGGAVGAFKVSIGQYDGDWRVSTSGQSGEMSYGKKNKKNWSTLFDFGDDQAAAISFAIKDAIADGAITGLNAFAQKALKSLDVDGAIALVQQYNEVTATLDGLLDPFAASIKEITSPLDNLATQMKSVGASTEELTKVDQVRTLKLKDALNQQLASLNDFIASLKGSGTGTTELARFESGMKSFEEMRAKIVAGDKSVDKDAFTKLGSELYALNTSLYGTATAQSQATRDLFLSTAELFKTNITTAFNTAAGTDLNAATTNAVNASAAQQQIANDQIITNGIVANDLQRQQIEELRRTNALLAQAVADRTPAGYNGRSGNALV